MYGLSSHRSVNPARRYGRKGDTRTGVCCKLFKSLFWKIKEACNKCISVEEEKELELEIMQASYIYTMRHSLNNFNIQRSMYMIGYQCSNELQQRWSYS